MGEAATADRNPIDLTLANLKSETYRDTIAALVDSPTYDALVVVVGSSGLGDPKAGGRAVRAAAAVSTKPVLVYVNPHALQYRQLPQQLGVAAFSTGRRLRRGAGGPPAPRPAASATGGAQMISEPIAEARRGPLNESEAGPLRRGRNRAEPATPSRHTRGGLALCEQVGHPVVVKILSRDIGHKSDVGGVRVGVPRSMSHGLRGASRQASQP